MRDALYRDERLVPLYDVLHGGGEGENFYTSLPTKRQSRILDVGCGTGSQACAFAANSHQVVAIDPARAMIKLARAKLHADGVSWHVATLETYTETDPFDLIVMTGHAFQCLLTDEDISNAFHRVRQLLAAEGRFVFDTRNPRVEPWTQWAAERSAMGKRMPDGRDCQAHHEVQEVNGELVRFRTRYVIGGVSSPIVSESVLRFADYRTIERLATAAGLIPQHVFGDWDRSPFSEASPEIIVTLR